MVLALLFGLSASCYGCGLRCLLGCFTGCLVLDLGGVGSSGLVFCGGLLAVGFCFCCFGLGAFL